MKQAIKDIVQNKIFRFFIISVILLNATIHGIQTNHNLPHSFDAMLDIVDGICLLIFTIEIFLKLYALNFSFFKSGWNIFDLIIIVISLAPNLGSFSVLRTFRVFRAFRLLSNVPSLRRVATALVQAIPSVISTIILISVLFYVFSVMAINLFGRTNPEIFGNLGDALFVLFQIMTLDDWSNEIARPVMKHHPHSWVFFVTFILLASFTALNLFVGIIVDAIHSTNLRVSLGKSKKTKNAESFSASDIEDLPKNMNEVLEPRISKFDLIMQAQKKQTEEIAELKKIIEKISPN